jgi:SPP1 gp7 family putative phage head morphogenesis protein
MITCPTCGFRDEKDIPSPQPAPQDVAKSAELVWILRQVEQISRELHKAAFEAEINPQDQLAQKRAAEAVKRLADIIARVMVAEDVAARIGVLSEVGLSSQLGKQIKGPGATAEQLLPRIDMNPRKFVTLPFKEAVADLVSKTPLASETAEDVAAAYEAHQFTLRQGISLDVVKTVQSAMARIIEDGGGVKEFKEFTAKLDEGLIGDAYAETLFRTERTSANAAGRIAQAFSPELDDFVIGFRYVAVGDKDTRPNHFANNGKQFAKRDPRWQSRIPPNGWNCRCRVVTISRLRAQAMGRLDKDGQFVSDDPPASGAPDPGFENSPLIEIYG